MQNYENRSLQAEEMVDAVVTVLLKKLLTALSEEGRVLSEFQGQFQKLQRELLLMQSFLKDAERLKRKNKRLSTIMAFLRDLIYEAEDILFDCQTRPENQNNDVSEFCTMCFHPRMLRGRRRASRRLREINGKITGIKQDISAYLGRPPQDQMSTTDAANHLMSRWSTPLYDHSEVVGLEGDTEKIRDWLFEANDGILAIGIVGMGGLGKTTIAQIIFNERRVEERFDRRIWVSVSQTCSEEQIMRSMLRSLGDASVGDDLTELLKKIKQYLSGKRYLIVMDDVWNLNNKWWDTIYAVLPKGNGSSIIVTTRIKDVARKMGVLEARMHQPKFLSEDNSWLLFRKVAFAATQGECTHPELEAVGKQMVEKCKGLPLAIKAVGGVMLFKPPYYHDWKRISDHFRDELAENETVKASLQLSYDELPPYLKSCFLCLSLYPEDSVIEKKQLIHWWIGEDFIPLRNGRLSTEAGEHCFTELTNRCLVEAVDKAYTGAIYTCKIHDMVRDLVIRIAEEEGFSKPNEPNCRHLGITGVVVDQKRPRATHKLRALLTITRSGEVNKIASNITKQSCSCPRLQVFDLSKSIFQTSLSSLLGKIGSLQNLTCLSLSNTHPLTQLPPSLYKLRKLQILDLSYCQNLKILPPYIITFQDLTVLDLSHCGSLEYLPKGLEKLSNLQVLLGFRPARSSQKEGCRVTELGKLNRLRELGLRLSEHDEIGDDEVNSLRNLHGLEFLSINCFESHEEELAAKLDKLSPPPELHELCLDFYPGRISPGWMSPSSLPMLKFLSISSSNFVKMNQNFWGDGVAVWKIEGVKLEALSDLSMEWSMVERVMPSLRSLKVSWCPELDSFPVEDAGFRGGVWKKE
ncbi:hypothetical protein NMG60_11007937 [Bertholletia excelsa]